MGNLCEPIAEDIRNIDADLRYGISGQLLATGLLIDKYIYINMRKYGHNRSRIEILHALITHGGILKPSEISKLLFRTKQTVTQTINGLEKDGLVCREHVGDDRRTKEVFITKKGLDSVKESLPTTLETANSAVSHLGENHLEELIVFLRETRKHLISQINTKRSDTILYNSLPKIVTA